MKILQSSLVKVHISTNAAKALVDAALIKYLGTF